MSRASATSRALDIAFADELGYRIKLLGIARRDRGRASSSACIPAWCRSRRRSPHVEGVFNAVVAEGDFVGRVMLEGRGAGAGPDRLGGGRRPDRHRARPRARRPSACRRRSSRALPAAPMERHRGAYYLRLMVRRPARRDRRRRRRAARRARLAGIHAAARPRARRGGAGRADHARDARRRRCAARSTRIAALRRGAASRRA